MSAALLSAVALLAAPPFEQQQTLERPGKHDAPAHASAAAEPRPIILIHQSKTGGTSIRVSLGMPDPPDPVDHPSVPECDAVPWILKHAKHDTAAIARRNYTDSEWEHAYKISFVRNPWEKSVSKWAMQSDVRSLNQNCTANEEGLELIPPYDGTSGTFCADAKPCAESSNTSDPSVGLDDTYTCSFTCWLENECYYPSKGEDAAFVEQLGYFVEPEVLARADASNARRLLEENSMVDFVGREENLTSHFYLALLGAGNNESVASACANNLLDVVEGSAGHDAYELYYADAPMRRLGEEMYAVDDAVFNYSFGVLGPYDVAYQRG